MYSKLCFGDSLAHMNYISLKHGSWSFYIFFSLKDSFGSHNKVYFFIMLHEDNSGSHSKVYFFCNAWWKVIDIDIYLST